MIQDVYKKEIGKNAYAISTNETIYPTSEYVEWLETKLKNLGEGEAGTGYALLSDGWRSFDTIEPKDFQRILVCRIVYDSVIEWETGVYDKNHKTVNIADYVWIIDNNVKWQPLTTPSF